MTLEFFGIADLLNCVTKGDLGACAMTFVGLIPSRKLLKVAKIPSGLNRAGKSTMVKLLCRFYDPTKGRITWDGVDLRDLDPAVRWERIGAVFQDPTAYDLTAAENIGVTDRSALDIRDRLTPAARDAGLHGTLAALPSGYDTLLCRIFSTPTSGRPTVTWRPVRA